MLSHPMIMTANSELRYNALLAEAETERLYRRSKKSSAGLKRGLATIFSALTLKSGPQPKAVGLK